MRTLPRVPEPSKPRRRFLSLVGLVLGYRTRVEKSTGRDLDLFQCLLDIDNLQAKMLHEQALEEIDLARENLDFPPGAVECDPSEWPDWCDDRFAITPDTEDSDGGESELEPDPEFDAWLSHVNARLESASLADLRDRLAQQLA